MTYIREGSSSFAESIGASTISILSASMSPLNPCLVMIKYRRQAVTFMNST